MIRRIAHDTYYEILYYNISNLRHGLQKILQLFTLWGIEIQHMILFVIFMKLSIRKLCINYDQNESIESIIQPQKNNGSIFA